MTRMRNCSEWVISKEGDLNEGKIIVKRGSSVEWQQAGRSRMRVDWKRGVTLTVEQGNGGDAGGDYD